jgi:hypothetical protein
MDRTFEYWDVGDRKWKRRVNELLEDAGITVKEWFRGVGIKVR